MFEALIKPFVGFVAFPVLALAPAVLFAWLWSARARPTRASMPVGIAAVLWFFYAVWEISFLFRPVREWIRVDLLLIAPILLVASAWALVAWYRARRS
jgi:hypothetical protein